MFENIKEEENIKTVGSYRIKDIDNPEKNALHPEAMTDEQKERYGKCHDMAKKFADENEADFYTSSNGVHSIAVKGGKVFDYVLGYNLDITVEEYIKKVPLIFKKVE